MPELKAQALDRKRRAGGDHCSPSAKALLVNLPEALSVNKIIDIRGNSRDIGGKLAGVNGKKVQDAAALRPRVLNRATSAGNAAACASCSTRRVRMNQRQLLPFGRACRSSHERRQCRRGWVLLDQARAHERAAALPPAAPVDRAARAGSASACASCSTRPVRMNRRRLYRPPRVLESSHELRQTPARISENGSSYAKTHKRPDKRREGEGSH